MEIIEQAVAEEPEALEAVIRHFSGYIRYLSYRDGRYNADIQERLESKLMAAVLTFRFDLNV
ncbi:helix-turn-helix domain-containing protein [Intestinimonas butyriciproducens]|uniref:helix-turn-helix domain-containing protein n=1 Tax=Intestinimonas butyriciproducens TaxID=1297617 RepID=UPI001FA72DDB|nr:helix-turn-helix domain-containing protein [Intestinimonas butyriciproducens]